VETAAICPWDHFSSATIHFCENQLCSYIVKPAETWSNIGYVLVGIYILYLCKKENNPHLRVLGLVGICLGFMSATFHATGTFFGEFLDVSSMYLLTATGISFNSRRLFQLSFTKARALFILILSLSMGLLLLFRPIGITLFGIQFVTAVILEVILFFKSKERAAYRYFLYMVVTFLTAWCVWWLDLLKIWCNPDNHLFNGHAFWHLETALIFYFIYRFFCQFKQLRS